MELIKSKQAADKGKQERMKKATVNRKRARKQREIKGTTATEK